MIVPSLSCEVEGKNKKQVNAIMAKNLMDIVVIVSVC
jgi:hypothetical protein